MSTLARRHLVAGALAMALAVACGAFGAHGLRGRIGDDLLTIWETAARYHAYHALGLVALGLLGEHLRSAPPRLLALAGRLMVAGIFLFSGSLYLLAASGVRWLGAITPLGGASWIAAWLLIAIALWKQTPRDA